MDKTKLAICIEDEEYKSRFARCVMHHYKDSYEIHIVDNIQEIEEGGKPEVIIIGDDTNINLYDWQELIILVLQEDVTEETSVLNERVLYTEKYQEVYKIMEVLKKAVLQQPMQSVYQAGRKETQFIGVFSLQEEEMQMPFTALLADVLGENNRVLVVDVQPFSGFVIELEPKEQTLGMEDLMAVATTEHYTSNRLAASIGHEPKWDYVYPVKNAQCLVEADGMLYQKMVEILVKEWGYEQVIFNLGEVFSGMVEWMELCQQFYILTRRKEERSWREEAFFQEMKCRGKEEFLQKLIWMEVPKPLIKERSWREMASTWLWSELGDRLRELHWVEYKDGSYM